MTYILMIYTIVASAAGTTTYSDWRPIGEFHSAFVYPTEGSTSGLDKCEAAAKQLSLKPEKYRCVRSK